MIEALSAYIRNIAIFLIFTTVAGMLMPESKYKGYVKLLLGFALIFLIISPINALMGRGALDDVMASFSHEMSKSSLQSQMTYDDSIQNELILSAYVDSLKQQIKAVVEREGKFHYVDSQISVADSEENFGDILSLSVTVTENMVLPEPTKKPFIRIEPVKIDVDNIFSTKYIPPEDRTKNEEPEEIKKLKNTFSDFYNLSHDNIHITVQKKK